MTEKKDTDLTIWDYCWIIPFVACSFVGFIVVSLFIIDSFPWFPRLNSSTCYPQEIHKYEDGEFVSTEIVSYKCTHYYE